jgi:hypothetical protein
VRYSLGPLQKFVDKGTCLIDGFGTARGAANGLWNQLITRTELVEDIPDSSPAPPFGCRHHIIYARKDLSDLIDLCRLYLEKDDAREALRLNSRSFFDRYLHRDQLAAYYLRCCLDRLT